MRSIKERQMTAKQIIFEGQTLFFCDMCKKPKKTVIRFQTKGVRAWICQDCFEILKKRNKGVL